MSTNNTSPRHPKSVAYSIGGEGEETFPSGGYYDNFGWWCPPTNIRLNTVADLSPSHEDFGHSTMTQPAYTTQGPPHFVATGPTSTPVFDPPGYRSSAANLTEPLSPQPPMQGTRPRYPCDVSGCPKTFAREYDIKRHKQNKHPVSGDPQYFCEFAGEDGCDRHNKPYSRLDKRKNHYISIHKGRKSSPIIPDARGVEDEDSGDSTEVEGRVKVFNPTAVDDPHDTTKGSSPVHQRIRAHSNTFNTGAAPQLRPAADSVAYQPPATVPTGFSPSRPTLPTTPGESQRDSICVGESLGLRKTASATASHSPRRHGQVDYQKAAGRQQQQQPLSGGPQHLTQNRPDQAFLPSRPRRSSLAYPPQPPEAQFPEAPYDGPTQQEISQVQRPHHPEYRQHH